MDSKQFSITNCDYENMSSTLTDEIAYTTDKNLYSKLEYKPTQLEE